MTVKREEILEALKEDLGTLSSIKTVDRVRPEFANLDQIANTELPKIALVGMLPKPVQKLSNRKQGRVDLLISELNFRVYCYALDNTKTADTTVSTLANAIWVKLWEVLNLGLDYVQGVDVVPNVEVGIWDPYIVFRMDGTITYKHDTGGI
jgi:hypothetical protein